MIPAGVLGLLSAVGAQQVLSVLSRWGNSAQSAQKPTAEAEPASDTGDLSAAIAPDRLQVLQKLARRYDLRHITADELAKLAQTLRDLGLVTEEQVQLLTRLRSQWHAAGIPEDRPLDLLAHCRRRLALAEEGATVAAFGADPKESSSAGFADIRLLREQVRLLERIAKLADLAESDSDESGAI